MEVFRGETRGEVWLNAVKHLEQTDHWHDFNLILEVKSPNRTDDLTRAAETAVDSLFNEAGVNPIYTIAETIFPAWLYRKHGATGVYDIYPQEIIPAIKDHPDFGWGTYALRMVRRVDRDGKEFNPLKDCIEKIKGQLATEGPKRACYELGILDPGFDLPLYEPATDRKRIMSGPCLSHLSFKISKEDQLVYLTALYRSHYYIERTLGNLLGLARLQAFVAEQVGLKVGPLLCISSYAKLDTDGGWTKTRVRKLIADLSTPNSQVTAPPIG